MAGAGKATPAGPERSLSTARRAPLRPPSGRPPLRTHRVAGDSANRRLTRPTTRSLAEMPYHPHIQHTNLGVTSIYLQGIDNSEIIDTVHARSPVIPAAAGLEAVSLGTAPPRPISSNCSPARRTTRRRRRTQPAPNAKAPPTTMPTHLQRLDQPPTTDSLAAKAACTRPAACHDSCCDGLSASSTSR
jgi:hypothetical protein